MSDVSSLHPDSSHSVSTDTEESFLIRQINKSQFFNSSNSNSNSNSNSSNSYLNTTNSDSNSKRSTGKSFFRESFIDENGTNKPFNIYQDVINENEVHNDHGHKNTELSRASSLNRTSSNPNTSNILADLDGNKTHSRSGSLKNITLSRSNSFQNHKRNKSRASINRSSSKTSIKRNSLGSINMLIPQPQNNSSNSNINSPSESTISSFSQTKNHQSIFGPNYNFQIYNNNNYNNNYNNPSSQTPELPPPKFEFRDSNGQINEDENEEPYNRESAYRERIISAYATNFDEYALTPEQEQQGKQPEPQMLEPVPNHQFKEPMLPQKGPQKKPSQSTFASSKSSNSTRRSILEYEFSRKKSPGLHPLMLHDNGSTQSSDGEVKIQNVNTIARRGLGFSIVGIVPSIHSAKSPTMPGFDIVDDKDDIDAHPKKELKEKDLQRIKDQQFKMFKNSHKSPYDINNEPIELKEKQNKTYFRESFDGSDTDISSYYDDDLLLKKIHRYRSNKSLNRNVQTKRADTMAWIIFLISFIVPPLFFFLGFGLLDQFIGRITPNIKKISLIVGMLVLLTSLACIGIGFGVGLASL
ncbi:putative membrane protein [Wickerhamomyces ciferrii]|uniref:Membrane protein n=1 Tax=Wickerhamomyces ciferrii (strain ATCC 14091 / BCRC 22168 / CBS 111 / JCM 3599 / NBRC 0793 / NRRL Y-1031 F-60-10) TaxID=1206466 RepID=K0KEG1_WICCF|nr:uncharacterized protein BN7_3076 [Wickerhamomyces ciferrii]CCH43525.1 putative membrane protein [Wickerhamomyces ciferrii]